MLSINFYFSRLAVTTGVVRHFSSTGEANSGDHINAICRRNSLTATTTAATSTHNDRRASEASMANGNLFSYRSRRHFKYSCCCPENFPDLPAFRDFLVSSMCKEGLVDVAAPGPKNFIDQTNTCGHYSMAKKYKSSKTPKSDKGKKSGKSKSKASSTPYSGEHTGYARVCKLWSVFPELKELEASAPCVALRRVIEEGVQMTLPGFDSETSAAVLAGVRQTFIIFFVRVQY